MKKRASIQPGELAVARYPDNTLPLVPFGERFSVRNIYTVERVGRVLVVSTGTVQLSMNEARPDDTHPYDIAFVFVKGALWQTRTYLLERC